MGCSNSQPPNPSTSSTVNTNTTVLSTYQHKQHQRQQRPKRSTKLSKHKTPLPPIYEDNRINNNNNLSATHQSFSYIHHKQKHVHNTTIPITSTHNNNNSTICATTTARQSSHTQSFSKRLSQSDIRRSECNGVVIVENVRKHLPKDINEDMIYELVANSLEGSIVDEKGNTTDKQGNKMVTQEQVKAIAEVVYDKLIDDDNNNNNARRRKKRSSIINGLNVRVGLRKLTPSLVKKTCFKGQNVTKMQIDNALKNISQGEDNVRILTVEIN
jgi:hypothetical protein